MRVGCLLRFRTAHLFPARPGPLLAPFQDGAGAGPVGCVSAGGSPRALLTPKTPASVGSGVGAGGGAGGRRAVGCCGGKK